MEECKRCLLHKQAEADTLKSIHDTISKLPENEKADTKTYNERLVRCQSCDNLISGVCIKCGCYVEFRAAFKNKKCPDIKDRKW